MAIVTKFTMATEEGIDILLALTRELAIEKFAHLLEQDTVEHYIAENFNTRTLTGDINSLANQWLVVFVDGDAAGYARITSKGRKPQALDQKKAIRIADFGVLKRYQDPAVKASLFEKCLTVCKRYEGIWINEYTGNSLLGFFESRGFVQQEEYAEHDSLPLASVYMIVH